jgi:hypothetical protein
VQAESAVAQSTSAARLRAAYIRTPEGRSERVRRSG